MRNLIIFSAITAVAIFSFIPLTLKEKVERADLIVVGTVVSVTHLLPTERMGGFDAKSPTYFGPASVAVVEVSESWKRPEKTRSFILKPMKSVVPRFIMVPCEYSFHESPSELTAGTSYVMFLRQMGDNFFHPLDPASTHVISQDRVATFGMDHPADADFESKSIPMAEFKKSSIDLLPNSKNPPPKQDNQDRRITK